MYYIYSDFGSNDSLETFFCCQISVVRPTRVRKLGVYVLEYITYRIVFFSIYKCTSPVVTVVRQPIYKQISVLKLTRVRKFSVYVLEHITHRIAPTLLTIYAQISTIMALKAQISVIITASLTKFGVNVFDIIKHAKIFLTCYISAVFYSYDCNIYEIFHM